MSAEPVPNAARARLRQHFLDHDTLSHPSRWDDLWTQSFTPWDQGRPSPALADLLASGKHLPAPQLAPPGSETAKDGLLATPREQQRIRRPRALVPGCGRGYDVLLLAAWGYDAWGLDSSGTAVKAAREAATGSEEREEYKVADEKVGKGAVEFVEADFWADEWWEKIDAEKKGFDVIYDYTFLSALPPSLRPAWSARMAQLLAPTGHLICLEFPTYKEPSTGGPPWALPPLVYIAHLSKPGKDVPYDEEGVVKDIDEERPERDPRGLCRIAHWKPERTHEIGKGTDWMSVWQHRQ